ncbi:acyl-CoA dehydrogenase family protein [Acidipila sp. EB88]|uniref:acyl-CoA dehydrogenase family protein n=1 Tax=Acidipila sp. EB88 TaxID=2305226 RepID=UPI001F41954F|nr:acyl-CoA dehydrogenase family protein [Acidipila sp. EB88]
MELGRQNLSLARLAEAHWDAVAILAEAGREPAPGAICGVWASEKPDMALRLERAGNGYSVTGQKLFCTGAGLVDRALVTVGSPASLLVEVDLRSNAGQWEWNTGDWKTGAFAETQTARVQFHGVRVEADAVLGDDGWYVHRPGFWHGACGPASCWAGGAAGLLDYALRNSRADAHTLAHLGAMHADAWALSAFLQRAGEEIDAMPGDYAGGCVRALTVRHLVEQAATDMLRRLPRAYGPYPLAMDAGMSRRCQELDLYLRQCHAERDLEALGRGVRPMRD